jgi:hypothetical protein
MSFQKRLSLSLRTANNTIPADVTVESAGSPGVDTAVATGSYRVDLPIGAYTAANLNSVALLASQTVTIYVGGTDEIQSVSISGTPAGGTFTLTFGAATTATIPFNATATQVQTALNAISTIGGSTHGSVVCTGGPLPGTPVAVRFSGDLAQTNVAAMTAASGGLTGGTTPTASVSTTTAGVAPDQTLVLAAGLMTAWMTGMLTTNPLTANASRWTCTNSSGAAAQVRADLGVTA